MKLREHPPPDKAHRRDRRQPIPAGDLNQETLRKYEPRSELSSQPSAELKRLLRRALHRLEFHRAQALGLAAISGAIQTELSRREI